MSWRRHNLDESVFDVPNTSEHWYWLGFLLADGCVFSRREGRDWLLQVKLQRGDRHLLESLRRFLRYSGPLRDQPQCNAVVLAVHSKRLCTALRDLGIVPRKSFDGHPLPIVPNEFAYAFARGHFDGNGFLHQRTARSYRLGYSGQRRLMRWLNDKLHHLVGVGAGRLEDKGGCASLVFGRRPEVSALVRWMYGNDDCGAGVPCLLRKRVAVDPLLREG